MDWMLKCIFVSLLMLNLTVAQAQLSGGSGGSRSGAGAAGGKKGQKAPKTKADSIVFKMREFKLIDELTRVSEVKVDTSITDFHIYHPAFKNSISVQNLGNIGNSSQTTDFFQRLPTDRDFLFQKNFSDYGLWPGSVHFYNVTKPYTLLTYGQWFSNKPKGETVMKVLHTQNINKDVNFGFYYNSIGSSGKYLNQQSKDRSVGLFSSGNFERYDYWLTIGKNRFENQENGGLPNPSDIENPDLQPENITVWLTDAKTINNNIFTTLTHQYKLGVWKEMKDKKEIFQQFIPRVTLMHVMDIQNSTRLFTEANPVPTFGFSDGRGTVNFYANDSIPFINKTVGSAAAPATIDRSGQSVVSNRFVLKFLEASDRKYTFGKQVFIANDLVNVHYPQQAPYLDSVGVQHAPLGLFQKHNYSNTYIGGSAYRTGGRFWSWNVAGKSYIQGRNALDYELSGAIEKPLRSKSDTSYIRIFSRMSSRTPDYFYENYYSNHYKWENIFDKTYTMRVGANFDKPGWRLKAAINYGIVNKYVFFNEKAIPEQAKSEFSVLQAMVNKDFKFGVLNIRNWVNYQYTTTSTYLALPKISVRNSIFIEGIYAKVLFFQLGLDTRYQTAFYADQYSPATGMFYRQNSILIGDYAWVDGFANLKLKRTAFYIKYVNLATQFVKGGFFTSPGYPAPVATLLFGLSWSFYD